MVGDGKGLCPMKPHSHHGLIACVMAMMIESPAHKAGLIEGRGGDDGFPLAAGAYLFELGAPPRRPS